MTKITYISSDGETHVIDAVNGTSVMENAINNSVPGIVAECGGACSCATCHVYVDPEWTDVVGASGLVEQDMLEFAWGAKENSRLSCQIKVTDALDGLVVRIPEFQGQ